MLAIFAQFSPQPKKSTFQQSSEVGEEARQRIVVCHLDLGCAIV
jgi:hypothetical protein